MLKNIIYHFFRPHSFLKYKLGIHAEKFMKSIELLLMQDVPTLGNKGKTVKVKFGFARNYLLPRKLATMVTKENLRLLEVMQKRQAQAEALHKEQLKDIGKQLEKTACTIEAKTNEEGHLFGSITYAKIAEQFQKQGFELKAEDIELEDTSAYPIKELGIFPIRIRLHSDVTTTSKVWVVNEPEPTDNK